MDYDIILGMMYNMMYFDNCRAADQELGPISGRSKRCFSFFEVSRSHPAFYSVGTGGHFAAP